MRLWVSSAAAAHSPLIQTVDKLFMTHISSPPTPKYVQPTYIPPAPTKQKIHNPLLIIYVPSLTNWLLWAKHNSIQTQTTDRFHYEAFKNWNAATLIWRLLPPFV